MKSLLAHASGKTFAGDGAGGLLTVRVPVAGRYRITLDAPMWLDVINADSPIESTAFQGQKPCTADSQEPSNGRSRQTSI